MAQTNTKKRKSTLAEFIKGYLADITAIPYRAAGLRAPTEGAFFSGQTAPTSDYLTALEQTATTPVSEAGIPGVSKLAQIVSEKQIPSVSLGNIQKAIQGKFGDLNTIPGPNPTIAEAGIATVIGAQGLQNVAGRVQWNQRLNEAMKGEELRGVVMENLPNIKTGLSTTEAGKGISKGISNLPIDQQAEFIIQQSERSPTLKSALDKFVEIERNIPIRKAELVGQRGSLAIPPEAGKPIEVAAKVGEELLKNPQLVPAIPTSLLQSIYKGKPIDQATRDKYPELKSGKHILNSPEDVAAAEAFRPKAIVAQKELDANHDAVIAENPRVTRIVGDEKITAEIRAKSPTSAALKVNRRIAEEGRLDYNVSKIKDWARQTFILPDMATHGPNVIKSFLQKYPGAKIKTHLTIPHLSGYMGVFLDATASNGVGVEDQLIMGNDGWDLKLKTDELYRPFRTMNFGKLNLQEKAEYNKLQELTHQMYLDFFAKKGYSGGSLSELESLIKAAASSSVIPGQSMNVAPGKGDLIQAPLAGENAKSSLPSNNNPLSVKPNLGNMSITSKESVTQPTINVKRKFNTEIIASAKKITRPGESLEENIARTKDWISATLDNDESSTDAELIEHFQKEGGFSKDVAEYLVSKRQQVKELPFGMRKEMGLRNKMRLNEKGSAMATGPEIRKFIETIKNSVATDPILAAIIDSRYTPKSNKMTLAEADTIIRTDYDLAYAMAMDSSKPSAVSNAIAIRLISQAQAKGNWEEAKRLVEMTAERNTAAGQAIQALSIYSKLAPEGVTSYATSVVNRAKVAIREAKLKEFEKAITGIEDDEVRATIARKMKIPYVSAKSLEEIYNDALRIQKMPEGRERMVATALMLKKIAANVEADNLSKISMLQTLAQLVNPKTVIRNILGNFVFMAAENAAQTFATGLDVMASIITKERTVGLPSLKGQTYGFVKGAREGLQEALLGINTRQLNTKFSLPRNGVFHKGVLNGLEKVLAVILQAPDRAFFEAAYVESLNTQCKLAHTTELTPNMMEQATLDGLYRTFQDRSMGAKLLTGIKKALNIGKGWGVGDMVIKYPATPGNIWSRGFEYSPGGFVKSMYHLGNLIRGYEKTHNQREFVRSMARAFTGSSLLFGTAATLAALGIISGKRDPDRDISGLKRTVGLKSYQVNLSALKRFIFSGMQPEVAAPEPNDILISYDWMLPASIPMVIGANVMEEAKRRSMKETPQPGQAVAEGMAEAANAMVDQPMLTGISQMRKSQDIYNWLVTMVTDIPASFTPTLFGQFSKLTDNIVRNTDDPNYFKQAYNKVAAKIPGLSKTLTPQLNVWGQPMKSYQSDTNNPFNVFLNPAFINKYKPTPEAKMALDIWQVTGESGVFPRVAPRTVTVEGRTTKLNPEMQRDYQEYIGNKTGVLFNILVNDPKFMAMPDELKAQKLQNYLTDINTSAKIELFGLYPKKTVRGQRVPYVPKRTQNILNLQ